MQKIRLSLDVVNSSQSHNMGIELRIDNNKIFDNIITPGQHHIIHDFDEEEKEYILHLVLKGKKPEDTKIDDQGNIIQDSLIEIKNICIDDINIDYLISELGQYIHDGNGIESSKSVHKFYGHMGCNGYVQLKFSCPIYLWLLENM